MKSSINDRGPAILDAPLQRDPGLGNLQQSGVIHAANETRFNTAAFSTPLTAFAVGWSDRVGIVDLLEAAFPVIEVPQRFTFKSAINTEAFFSEVDDVRTIGSQFKRVEYTGIETEARALNKGLTIRIDADEQTFPGWQEQAVSRLMTRLAKNELRRGIALIDAAAVNTGVTWGTTQNPDGDLRTALRGAKAIQGLRPNTVLFGGAAWDKRANCYEGNTTNATYALLARMTPDEVRQKMMLDKLLISEAVYALSVTGTKTEVVNQLVYGYFAESGLAKDDPSNVKRFVAPTEAGRFRVYVNEFNKYTEISVEHYSNIIVTTSTGICKLTVS